MQKAGNEDACKACRESTPTGNGELMELKEE